ERGGRIDTHLSSGGCDAARKFVGSGGARPDRKRNYYLVRLVVNELSQTHQLKLQRIADEPPEAPTRGPSDRDPSLRSHHEDRHDEKRNYPGSRIGECVARKTGAQRNGANTGNEVTHGADCQSEI